VCEVIWEGLIVVAVVTEMGSLLRSGFFNSEGWLKDSRNPDRQISLHATFVLSLLLYPHIKPVFSNQVIPAHKPRSDNSPLQERVGDHLRRSGTTLGSAADEPSEPRNAE
jgi:hypothetical protein